MIYFDNAATTFPKPKAIVEAVKNCLLRDGGNPGRGAHDLAMRATDAVYETREAVCDLLGFSSPERVFFTENATYALNTAIKTTLPDGCRVLISDLEHNALYRPLKAYAQTHGIEIGVFSTEGNIEENIRKKITDGTFALLSTLRSNVTGKAVPIGILSKIRAEKGLFLIVDASQSVGHEPIDLSKTPVDILCAPGHKGLFGIQGCGFGVFCGKAPERTWIEGGSGAFSVSEEMPDSLPERLEAGTLPLPSIVSLRTGIEYVRSVGEEKIAEKLDSLTERAREALSSLKNVEYLSGERGIISFRLAGQTPDETAEKLNACGIAVRSGLHCAPLAHKTFGTLDGGTVRVSFSYLNRKTQVAYFAEKIKKIAGE